MNSREYSIIKEYYEDLKEPVYGQPECYFNQIVYSRWIVNEVLNLLRTSHSVSSIQVLEEFVHKLDKFSCISPRTSLIFSIAKDAAEDILDRFIAAR